MSDCAHKRNDAGLSPQGWRALPNPDWVSPSGHLGKVKLFRPKKRSQLSRAPCVSGSKIGSQAIFRRFRNKIPAAPIRPVPSKIKLLGSGVATMSSVPENVPDADTSGVKT